MSDIINQNTEPLFIFDTPDDETLSETISVKGEKGERGDPTKLSELTNDTGFITKDVSNLTNYYKKTETDAALNTKANASALNDYYNKTQVDSKFTALPHKNISTQNNAGTGRYYKIATMPANTNSTSAASMNINGRIGGYEGYNSAHIDITLANRGGFRAYGSYDAGESSSTRARADVVAYLEESGLVTIYLYRAGYSAVDINLSFRGVTYEYDGTSVTEPSGTKAWSLNDDDSLKLPIKLPDFFLAAFFESTSAKTGWYVSPNGVDFTPINIPKNFAGRDPSLAYNEINKTFYVTYTTSGTNSSIKIWTSQDLTTWTEHTCAVSGMSGAKTWAPDLFIDNDGTLYAVVSNQYGDETDATGGSIPAFDLYLIRCNNIDNLTFDAAVKIDLSESPNRNHIDGSLTKIGDTYYLVVKNEYSKITEIFSSSDLSTFTLANENVTNSTLPLEGATLVPTKDSVYFLADGFNNGRYISAKTALSDFPSFPNNFTAIKSLQRQRHGSMIYVTTNHAKRLISRIDGFSFAGSNDLGLAARGQVYVHTAAGGTGNYLLNGNLCVLPNSQVNFAGAATVDVRLRNLFGLDEFKFNFGAAVGATIRITHIDDVELTTPIVVKNNKLINGKVMSIPLIYPDICDTLMFGTETAAKADLTDISEDVTVNYLNCYKVGNVVTLNFKITTPDAVTTGWQSAFTMPAGFRPPNTVLLENDKDLKNLQMASTGAVNGDFRSLGAGGSVFVSATYIALN